MHLSLSLLFSLISLLTGSDEIEIVFAGDAMQHQSQLDAAMNQGGGKKHDYSGYFEELEPLIKSADYAVVNLECPLGGKRYTGYPTFCAPDAYACEIKKAGFDLALTANNHILDRGGAGLKRTINVLDSIGLPHIGTYADVGARDSAAAFIADIKGFKVGFLNYTYSTNGIPCPKDVVVDYLDLQRMKSDIGRIRMKGAEIVIVCPHWGEEYRLLPEKWQRKMEEELTASGADAVVGGHPHVIQPMELRDNGKGGNVAVAYSLGNFISGMRTEDTRGGAMCTLKISRDEYGKPYISEASYRLVYTERPGAATGKNYRVVPAEKPIKDTTQDMQRKKFVSNAEKIFKQHNINVERDTISPEQVLRNRLEKLPYSIRVAHE